MTPNLWVWEATEEAPRLRHSIRTSPMQTTPCCSAAHREVMLDPRKTPIPCIMPACRNPKVLEDTWIRQKEASTLSPQCTIMVASRCSMTMRASIFLTVLVRAKTHSKYHYLVPDDLYRNISAIKPTSDAFDPPPFSEGESMLSQTPQN